MPLRTLQDPEEVMAAIEDSQKRMIVHYWAPWMGEESPMSPIFKDMDETRGEDVDFVMVDSGFIRGHDMHEMPLTVLYDHGEEIDTAPFDPNEVMSLIERA
ncbi:uncharacterized protein N7484_006342 [Penicillium longicatenatum]|uniref:uncharacterized protein n=1 Tax=Penicillium longicatenatum TaxID=1561947 RepID=UPI0025467D8A|nr:uncharacterized protein N7484_006342 [Penicillium longicatenatum]KAJ5643835.1 hypothetical protein N7484_006342 [Penicillium longicatenatum]